MCKRLSVRNPYPHATRKGTQGRNIKKGSSIFDDSLFKSSDVVPSAAVSVPAETTKSNVENVFANQEKIVTTQRPAMDIFKAVFEDDKEENEQQIISLLPPQLTNEEDHAEIQAPAAASFSSIEPKNSECNEDEDDAFPFKMIQKQKEAEKKMKEVQNESLKPSCIPQGILTPKEKPTGGSNTSNVSNNEGKLAALQLQIQELKQILGDDVSSSSSSSSESNRKRKRKRKSKSKHKKEKHHHRSHRKHLSSDENDNEEARHRKHKKSKHRRKD